MRVWPQLVHGPRFCPACPRIACSAALTLRVFAQAEEDRYGYSYEGAHVDDSDDDPDYGKAPRKKKAQRRHKLEKAQEKTKQPKDATVNTAAPAPGVENKTQKVASSHDLGQMVSQKVAAPSPATVGAMAAENMAGPAASLASAQSEGDLGLSATGRRKRKDTGATRTASRAWDDQEEEKFIESLKLYGRDWKKCAEHIGSRDARAVASHTQKFLIKALLRGEELPPEMAKTGRGYTLSGKPLDPNSSAARAYGLRPAEFERIVELGFLIEGVHVTTLKMDAEASLTSPKAPKQKKEALPAKKKRPIADDDEDYVIKSPVKPTEYSINRPRRTLGTGPSHMGDTSESLDLTEVQEFMGPIGAEGGRCQPFAVTISEDAALVMDFHAHLSAYEVIGLLGGTVDTEGKEIVIKGAYPCKRSDGSESLTSVELDPVSQSEATELMAKEGLIPVGWYHSHPKFEARPSNKDNENQRNHQAHVGREHRPGFEPWVGVIVGPYEETLPTPASQIRAWIVRTLNKSTVPFNIKYKKQPDKATITPELMKRIEACFESLVGDPGRLNMADLWRPFTFIKQGLPDGDAMKRVCDTFDVHTLTICMPRRTHAHSTRYFASSGGQASRGAYSPPRYRRQADRGRALPRVHRCTLLKALGIQGICLAVAILNNDFCLEVKAWLQSELPLVSPANPQEQCPTHQHNTVASFLSLHRIRHGRH
jgi:SHAQKYF class myb-like DNA-binding protein